MDVSNMNFTWALVSQSHDKQALAFGGFFGDIIIHY